MKPVHRSPSVSVLCYCILSLILINQMQRAGVSASTGMRPNLPGSVRGGSNVSLFINSTYSISNI